MWFAFWPGGMRRSRKGSSEFQEKGLKLKTSSLWGIRNPFSPVLQHPDRLCPVVLDWRLLWLGQASIILLSRLQQHGAVLQCVGYLTLVDLSLLSEKFWMYCLKIICMSPPLPPVFIGHCQVSSPCPCPLPPWSTLEMPHWPVFCPPWGCRLNQVRGLWFSGFLSFPSDTSGLSWFLSGCSLLWACFLFFVSVALWFYKSIEVVLEFSS